MLQEFRKFIARGNVIDLAVGIVIGAAFTSVVKSFVDDILMPPIGLLSGGVDFSNLFISLSGTHYASLAEAKRAGAATLNYGVFLNNVISFLIVAFAVFLLVQAYHRVRAREEAAPPAPTEKECPFCRLKIPLAASRCPHCTSTLERA
ncbi:MAG: large conductance mechanosensitive channel protein MscL [Pseudomonadota bacterium]|uniref:large conductance mechanosensitive channel protein MscL n=1 Tax=Thermithiobacillus tepidarius TaxID=929 RepID=UPI0004195A19|nr:large conductance mechanosensitive channel protein MscL [Thermithiobacillus tepidarius]